MLISMLFHQQQQQQKKIKLKKKGHGVVSTIPKPYGGGGGCPGVIWLHMIHIRMNEWSNPREKFYFDSKTLLPRMTRKLPLLVWALALQILPLHAQEEEDHSNDDIQDPNTPISLVRPFFFFLFFLAGSIHCRCEQLLLPQTDSFPPFPFLPPSLFFYVSTKPPVLCLVYLFPSPSNNKK